MFKYFLSNIKLTIRYNTNFGLIANNHTLSGIQARNAVASIKDALAYIHIPLTKLPTAKKAVKPVNPLKSIQELKEKPVVYPNPAKDLLYLNLTNITELPDHLKIKVYNSNGILVHQVQQKVALLNELNVSNFAQGTYFIEVLDEHYQLINRSKIILIK